MQNGSRHRPAAAGKNDMNKRDQPQPVTARNNPFEEHAVLDELKQFLPELSPAGKANHRNPLVAFQHLHFYDALHQAAGMLGTPTTLSLEAYRSLYNAKKVKPEILEKVLVKRKGPDRLFEWLDKVLMKKFPPDAPPKIGALRTNWQRQYKTDLGKRVHPRLFRIVASYIDHGTADWIFPVRGQGFLDSMREMESHSFVSVFNSPRARNLLLHKNPSISDLLAILVGEERFFKQYLFDQQFAHRDWSGLVATLENIPGSLPNGSTISLHDLIVFELLLEIDVLEDQLGNRWQPLAARLTGLPDDLFAPIPANEKSEVLGIWQEAFEWSHYEGVLAALKQNPHQQREEPANQMHANDTADTPECIYIIGNPSLKRHIPSGYAAFVTAYDFKLDLNGDALEKIFQTELSLRAAANLECFFSQTANAGTGARHTTGPVRLLCIVEHFPETVQRVAARVNSDWLRNEWVHLAALNPESHEQRIWMV